jgi:mannose-1-phosphate guanylyltransferase
MKFVIRAGGVGTRLWPFSRQSRPKQFHAMAGAQTMIQDAVRRLGPIADPADIHVSTGAGLVGLVQEQLPELDRPQLIVEPALRNTGPAVGLECALLEARHPGCIIASLGSDHYIGKAAEFCRLLQAAEKAVTRHPDHLVMIGVKPVRPETGYGYIQKGPLLEEVDGEPVFGVGAFKEKPDLATAQAYLGTGEYLWNSNMFVWKASTVLALYERFEPRMYEGLRRIQEAVGTDDEARVIDAVYPTLAEVAVDNAIIEKAPKVATIEGDFEWGDIGSWAALTDVLPADGEGNLFSGEVKAIDAKNVTAYGPDGKLIALIGVEDLVVVDTPDALLVCRKDEAQRVKDVLALLKGDGDGGRYI